MRLYYPLQASGQVLEGHKITHSDHGLSRLPPMCTHEDGHFQCSFSRIDGRRVDFFKRPPYISLYFPVSPYISLYLPIPRRPLQEAAQWRL